MTIAHRRDAGTPRPLPDVLQHGAAAPSARVCDPGGGLHGRSPFSRLPPGEGGELSHSPSPQPGSRSFPDPSVSAPGLRVVSYTPRGGRVGRR